MKYSRNIHVTYILTFYTVIILQYFAFFIRLFYVFYTFHPE